MNHVPEEGFGNAETLTAGGPAAQGMGQRFVADMSVAGAVVVQLLGGQTFSFQAPVGTTVWHLKVAKVLPATTGTGVFTNLSA
jgi:hypothetical protein